MARDNHALRGDAASPGLLILDGVLTRDVYLEDVVGTELLGAGDLLQPWAPAGPERLLGDEALWTVLAECRIAVLDPRCAVALARYPEICRCAPPNRLDCVRRALAPGESSASR